MGILKKIGESILIGIMILLGMLAITFVLALAISQGLLSFLITIIIIIASIVYLIMD